MKEHIKSEGKDGLKFLIIGIICIVIFASFIQYVPEKTFGYFIFNVVLIIGSITGVFVGAFMLIGFSHDASKEMFQKHKQKKELNIDIQDLKNDILKEKSTYQRAKTHFSRSETNSLIHFYTSKNRTKLNHTELLALEDELVNRKYLQKSPEREKLKAIQKHFGKL